MCLRLGTCKSWYWGKMLSDEFDDIYEKEDMAGKMNGCEEDSDEFDDIM